ncbi:hypothetical protein VI817_002828 [Penicillium citrinum]|nr:hypothetical protein VI817_002828 [Penicillium citrinum]
MLRYPGSRHGWAGLDRPSRPLFEELTNRRGLLAGRSTPRGRAPDLASPLGSLRFGLELHPVALYHTPLSRALHHVEGCCRLVPLECVGQGKRELIVGLVIVVERGLH